MKHRTGLLTLVLALGLGACQGPLGFDEWSHRPAAETPPPPIAASTADKASSALAAETAPPPAVSAPGPSPALAAAEPALPPPMPAAREGVERVIERILAAAGPSCAVERPIAAAEPRGEAGFVAAHRAPGALGVHRVAPSAPAGAAGKCAYPVLVEPSSQVMASTNGVRVRITTAFVAYTQNDAELAFVIAHEIVHLARGHTPSLAPSGRRQQEYEADRHGLELVAAAGYDPALAIAILDRLATANLFPSDDANYPPFAARADALRAQAAELVAATARPKAPHRPAPPRPARLAAVSP